MRIALLTTVMLCSCAGEGTVNYAGTMTPSHGTCDPAGQASLTVKAGKAIFAPQAGTVQLAGAWTGETVTASITVLDANKHPYTLAFEGRANGQALIGTYTTPRCLYQVQLKRTND